MELEPLRSPRDVAEASDFPNPSSLERASAETPPEADGGFGVTSAHAQAKLEEALRQLDGGLEDRRCGQCLHLLAHILAQPWVPLASTAFLASLLAAILYGFRGEAVLAAAMQAAIILLSATLDVALHARHAFLERREVVARFRHRLRSLSIPLGLEGCCGTHGAASFQGAFAYRDGRWRFVPRMLLVAGDLILQDATHRIVRIRDTVLPERLRAFFSPEQLASNGGHGADTRDTSDGSSDSDADADTARAYGIAPRSEPAGGGSPTAHIQREVNVLLTKVALVSLAVILTFNVIRLFTVPNSSWIFLFLLHPAYVTMAALPIPLRLFTRVRDLLGNAQLLGLLRGLYSPSPSSSSAAATASFGPSPLSAFDPGASSSDMSPMLPPTDDIPAPCTTVPRLAFTSSVNVDTVGRVHIPLRAIVRSALRILRYERHEEDGLASLAYAADLFHSLGATTVVCCVDKEGVLSEIVPTPEKVLVMKRRVPETPGVPPSPGPAADLLEEVEDLPPSLTREELDPSDNPQFLFCAYKILSLTVDRSSDSRVRFDDNRWAEFAPVLKPIGLNCLVHAMQSVDESERVTVGRMGDVSPDETLPVAYDELVLRGKHLFCLAKEIGVTGETIACLRKRIHTIHVVDTPDSSAEGREPGPALPPTVHQMVSLVAEDSAGEWQLLTIGSPEVVLDCCPEYWDGEECARLTSIDRQQLVQQAGQWGKGHDLVTVAFAYRPIPPEYRENLNALESRIFRCHTPLTIGSESTDRLPSKDPEPQNLRDDALIDALEADQIFLGYVGLRHQPGPHVPEVLELLRRAGIRFTYFSPTSEQKTKAFGDRLGLYTDWNCCISLRSRHVSLDATSLKARLPHGIGAIKAHLIKVDNVPLLVSLFCDATPLSTSRMINILQHYHEVVCAVGSALNHNNPRIFTASDCAVSLFPAVNEGLVGVNKAFTRSAKPWFGALGWGTKDNGDWSSDAQAAWQLGSLLATPCALSLPSVEFPFYALLCLIQRARILLHATGRCYQLLVFSNVFTHLLLVSGNALFLPPVLTGIQTLWLVLVVLPVLASSVFHTRSGGLVKSMADIIPAKHDAKLRAQILHHCRRCFYIQILPSIPVLLFLFAACLRSTHRVPWSGVLVYFTDFNDPGQQIALLVSQNVAAFFVVLWMLAHSVGCLSRHRHLHQFQPWRQGRWALQSTVALILQVASGAFSLWITAAPDQRWSVGDCFAALGPEVYCVGFLWPFAIVAVDEALKRRRRKGFLQVQKRLKLEFDTRLGAFSPT